LTDVQETVPLIAYQLSKDRAPTLAPAPRWRSWMNETHDRWANRCLPLLIANEAGWVILNRDAFEATWNGANDSSGTTLEFDAGSVPAPRPESHFGYGIVTWVIPYLFRTPPGYNLLARGPANWPKDGATALEGLVETDWSFATFTMNWKLTRPTHPVRFEVGEPICMIVPQQRNDLRRFSPEIRDIRSDAEAWQGAGQFAEKRHELAVQKFLARYALDFEEAKEAWQRDYFKGLSPDGSAAPEHETQLRLPPFADSRPDR
jgi:hypothetical protein